MALKAEFEVAVPPSPDEWHDMENTHLAWLRIAHVIASAPSDDCVKELVASMPAGRLSRKDWLPQRAFFMNSRNSPAPPKSDSLTHASQSNDDGRLVV